MSRLGSSLVAMSYALAGFAAYSILSTQPDMSTLSGRHLLARALAIGSLSAVEVLIAIFPLRRGERWAFWATLLPLLSLVLPVMHHRCDTRHFRPPARYAHSVRRWLNPSNRRPSVGSQKVKLSAYLSSKLLAGIAYEWPTIRKLSCLAARIASQNGALLRIARLSDEMRRTINGRRGSLRAVGAYFTFWGSLPGLCR